MRATKEDFWDWVGDLDNGVILDWLNESRQELIEWHCTPSKIEAFFQGYLESECYRCEDCREWFTSIDDLNEDNLCEACAYEETVREKAETEFRKEVMDEKEN